VEEPGRPPCGPPAFQIKCNSSGSFVSRSVYQAYQVVSIFPDNQSLHVVNHNLPLATGADVQRLALRWANRLQQS
jgi:hypothetical protein